MNGVARLSAILPFEQKLFGAFFLKKSQILRLHFGRFLDGSKGVKVTFFQNTKMEKIQFFKAREDNKTTSPLFRTMVKYFLPIENFYNLNLATLKVLGPLFNQVFQFGRHFEAIGQLLGGNSQKLRMTFYQINASFGDFSDELDSTSLKSPSLDRGLE